MGEASARPERLKNFRTTTGAIKEGLRPRTGFLRDSWDAYRAGNETGWRFEFGDLADAIEAFADTLANIGEFTGGVGDAFEEADDGSGLVTTTDAWILSNIDDEWRDMLSDPAADRCVAVDWGEPGEPPPWLEALQTTSMVLSYGTDGTSTLRVSFVQAVSGYTRADGTVVDGYLRYTPGTGGRDLLGSFASARSLRNIDAWLGGAADTFGGFMAGLDQWSRDAGSLNYTDAEQLERALLRGGGTTAAGLGGGALGAAVAPAICGPGAPVCAGVVIIGTGLAVSGIGDRIMDWLIDEPGPAEHDPDLVEERVSSGGGIMSRSSEALYANSRELGQSAAMTASAQSDSFIQALAIDPWAAEAMDLPSQVPIIEYGEAGGPIGGWEVGSVETGSAGTPDFDLTEEEIDDLVEYLESIEG